MSNYYQDQIYDQIIDAVADMVDAIDDCDRSYLIDQDALNVWLCDQMLANWPDVGG